MNLGLDVLNDHQSFSMEEFLMEFYEGYIALETEEYQLSTLCGTYASLEAISGCIHKHGVTQSLETLYGENFSGVGSMEEETEAAKKGIFKRLGETIMRWLAKFAAWIKSLFSKTKTVVDRLRDIAEHAGDYELPISVYKNEWLDIGKRFSTLQTELESNLKGADDFNSKMEAINKAREEAERAYNEAKADKNGNTISDASTLSQYATTLANRINLADTISGIAKDKIDYDNPDASAIKKGFLKMVAGIKKRTELRIALVHAQLLFSQLKKK